MPIPSYRLHEASGQAVVTILGKDIYLGVHLSPESLLRYGEVIATYKSTGSAPLPAGAGLAAFLPDGFLLVAIATIVQLPATPATFAVTER